MEKHKIIEQYDYLSRLAAAKCRIPADAEDLVADTILAALAYLHAGGVIKYPKTWLANTLMHKYADMCRRRAGVPRIVSLDLADPDSDDDFASNDDFTERFFAGEEAAAVRRELNFLAHITRETLMRYYVRGESVKQIAESLGIPEGTVKSRLDAGRRQVRKGLEAMEEKKDYLPGRLHIANSGSSGPKGEPMSLIEDDLIAQNLLMIAYDKPLGAAEIARRIGIPTVYVEPILEKLTDSELMVKTEGERYYTDFLITYEPTEPDGYHAKMAFVREHYPVFREEMQTLIGKFRELNLPLRERQAMKLERYLVLKTLQNFELVSVPELRKSVGEHPKRRDGGSWTAWGIAYAPDYSQPAWREEAFGNYIWGGHRTSDAKTADAALRLCEFDTQFWDSPHRFAICGFDTYFDHIHRFLWQIYSGESPDSGEFPTSLTASVEQYETLGLLTHLDGKLAVDIPVLSLCEYRRMESLSTAAYEALCAKLGDVYREWVLARKKPIPPHLTSVPAILRYETNNCIAMGVVRALHADGLHMQGVDYCCPPMVLVYEKK